MFRPGLRLAVLLALLPAGLAGMVASPAASEAAGAAEGSAWSAWTSSPTDPGARLVPSGAVAGPATRVLDVAPAETHQTWLGVGAALTDSARQILQGNDEATHLLFDPVRADGAHLNLVRVPLSATDFSTQSWAFGWNDDSRILSAPAPATANAAFLADEIVPLAPGLKAVAAAWSAPAPMKDSGSLNGGSLKAASTAAYGRLLLAQADWLRDNGVPLHALSLGNEPFHSSSGYPTMLMSTTQMSSLAAQVSTALHQRSVQLWAVDHNWEHRASYDAVVAGAPGSFDAAAFHCYGGSVGQMYGVAVPPVMTECTGTDDGFAGTFRWDTANLVVGAVNAGSTGLMMWNLALDQNHGPHTGGCSTCRGVVDVDTSTGAVSRTPEFYVLAQLARAAEPGAVVVGSAPASGVPFVAFRNPDGTIGVVGHNDSGTDQVVVVARNGVSAGSRFLVRPGELFTLRERPDDTPPQPSPVQNLAAPSVLGTPKVGRASSATTGTWSPGDAVLAHQWLRDGTPITGATTRTYTPGPADVGRRLAVRVTGSAGGFTPAWATSLPTAPVVRGTLAVIARGRVAGIARVGRILQVRGVSSTPSARIAYRWRRSGVAITGATRASYRLVRADRGRRISVRLTLSAPGYAPVTYVLVRAGAVR